MRGALDFHADDFALTAHSDGDIISLLESGALGSISVMPNMSGFPRAKTLLEKLGENIPYPKIAVHVNLMEGKSLCPHGEVPHLTDEGGYFRVSWGRLLLWNYNPLMRKRIRHELAAEIEQQVRAVIDSGVMRGQHLRFDSHQHPHMIPLVFDALCDAVTALSAQGIDTEFIRNARDPLLPYIRSGVFLRGFSPANFAKCLILNWYAHRVSRRLKKLRLDDNCFCGVFFSGKMDAERVARVLPVFERIAARRGTTAEVLFHPGTALVSELGDEFTKPGFNDFHTSPCRKMERDAARELTKNFHKE